MTATAIYTYESFAGRPNQDGTSQAAVGATRILVPFDVTPGYSTGIAVVNPTGSAENISVNIELDSGATSQSSLPSLPPAGQTAFSIATQFPATAGHRFDADRFTGRGRLRQRDVFLFGTRRRTLYCRLHILDRRDQRIHVHRHRPANRKHLLHEQRFLQQPDYIGLHDNYLLAPGPPSAGNVTGSVNLVSGLASISDPLTGTYMAQ